MTKENNASQCKGKTAVISGGAEGIGLSIAKALGEQQMNVVLADIDDKNLQKARAELESLGVPVLSVSLDVADELQWQSVAQQAVVRFGKIHMVVNNAGVGADSGPIESQEKEGWQWALDVNLMGVVYGAKVMVPLIKDHGEGGKLIGDISGKKILIIDDVLTAGTAIKETFEIIQQNNAKAVGAIVALDRMEKNTNSLTFQENLEKSLSIPILSIATFEDLKK